MVTSISHNFKIRRFLEKDFFEAWSTQVQDAIFSFILNLSESELKVTCNKKLFLKTFLQAASEQSIAHLIDLLGDLVKNNESIDQFRLNLILKYLHSDSLQKRVKGVNDLTAMLKKTLRKKSFFVHEEDQSLVDQDFMVTWLAENNIMDYLLRGNMHLEVLQRISFIFYFLAKVNKFSSDHLGLLWDACMVTHIIIFVGIYGNK